MTEMLPPTVATLEGQIESFEKAFLKANDLLTRFATTIKRVQDRLPGLNSGLDDLDVMLRVLDERLTGNVEHFAALNAEMAKTRAEATRTAAAVDKATAGTLVGGGSGKGAALAGAEAEKATSKVERLKQSLAGMAGASQVVGMAVGFIGYEAVKMAMSFDAAMTKLHTQAHVSLADVNSLKGGVLDLAGQVGFSPDSLAEALYHIESNFSSLGITGPQALNMLKVAAQGAAVGHADLVDVTNALTAAVAAQIPGVENLDQAMGVLNATVGAGDMSMQDLANAFSTGMLATVKGFGLTIRDVGASMAVLGDNNMRGQVAANNFRMAVQAMAMPVSTAKNALDRLGLTTTTLAEDMQTGGLNKAVTDLHQRLVATGNDGVKMGEILTQAFGRKAGTALNILLSQYDRLESKYPELDRGARDFGDAWARTQETFQQRWKDLVGTFDQLSIRVGEGLIPILGTLMGWLVDGVTWIEHNRLAVAALAGALGGILVAGLGAALIALGEFVGATGGIVAGIGAAAGVILALTGGPLADLARWLDHNRELALLLAVVIGSKFLPSMAAVQVALNRFVVTPVVVGLVAIIDQADGAVAGLKALRAAILSTETVATAGLAAAALGAYNIWQSFQGQGGQDIADKILANFDPNKIDQATSQIGQMTDAVHQAQQALSAHVANTGFLQDWWNLVHGSGDNTNTMANNIDKMTSALDKARTQLDNVHENLVMLSMQTGVSTTDLQQLAQAAGVDLSGQVSQSQGQRAKLLDYMDKLAAKTGLTKDAMAQATKGGAQDWQQFAQAIDKAEQAADKAFTSATNVIANFTPNNGSLKKQYDDAIQMGTQFVNDINAAMRRGLDPSIISQLLAAGPAKAEPYLKAVLAGHSNTMIQMANRSEAALASINATVIEQARLTQIAVSSTNSQTSLDFSKAAAISQKFIASQGSATIQEIARSLHMSSRDVQRIAWEFGISLSNAVQGAVDANPITVHADGTVSWSGLPIKAHARGGITAGGPVWVGERGPELVDLPGGSHVHTNQESTAMSRGGGGGVPVVNVYIDGQPVYGSVRVQAQRRDFRNRNQGLVRPQGQMFY